MSERASERRLQGTPLEEAPFLSDSLYAQQAAGQEKCSQERDRPLRAFESNRQQTLIASHSRLSATSLTGNDPSRAGCIILPSQVHVLEGREENVVASEI